VKPTFLVLNIHNIQLFLKTFHTIVMEAKHFTTYCSYTELLQG